MSKKRKGSERSSIVEQWARLPLNSKETVRRHINSVYVGSILRIYDRKYGEEGQLVTVHWCCDDDLFVTLHDEKKCDFITLKYQQWVVDQRLVKPGAFRFHKRYATDDIRDDTRNKTINELKQINRKILTNNMLMDFPTERDRKTYECSLFSLTCNCGYSKQVKKMECSQSNVTNAGKMYYACQDRYTNKLSSCNFFVWAEELEHSKYITCLCGKLCKKVKWSLNGCPFTYKFVCVNRSNKFSPGCNFVEDV